MALNIMVYTGDKYISAIKFRQSGPHTEGWKMLGEAGVEVIEVTDFDLLPETGAFWDGSAFSGAVIHNHKTPNMAHFAFVLDNVCVARSDLPTVELADLVEAFRGTPRFEVNETADDGNKREVRPWDFLNPNTEYAGKELSKSRLDICKGCEFFIKATAQCTKCGCFMHLKTKLADASCPVNKW